MSINCLQIKGVRNLKSVRLDHCGRINIISGSNGSGKTSLLEAIYLLGSGRSFRSSRLRPLVNQGIGTATVFADVLGPDGTPHTLGLSRESGGQQRFRLNRRPVVGAAELARILPVQILDADSFSLLDGGPAIRRRYIDWAVFHVKPVFYGVWQRAQKALRQRNHLLRQGSGAKGGHGRIVLSQDDRLDPLDIRVWEREFAFCAETIDQLRAEVMKEIIPFFQEALAAFGALPELSIEYRRGWRAEADCLTLLEEGRERDRERGFTQIGPHRANLELKANGVQASEFLSRGQQKLVVSALKLAQGACLAGNGLGRCVFLVDDLPAELDQQHRATLCRLLDSMGGQVFITSVDVDVIENAWFGQQKLRSADTSLNEVMRFHVEQGEYRCQKM